MTVAAFDEAPRRNQPIALLQKLRRTSAGTPVEKLVAEAAEGKLMPSASILVFSAKKPTPFALQAHRPALVTLDRRDVIYLVGCRKT